MPFPALLDPHQTLARQTGARSTPEAVILGPAGQELYRGLKHYGVESELVVYPREPHGLREEKHLLDRLNRILAWYDAHMK